MPAIAENYVDSLQAPILERGREWHGAPPRLTLLDRLVPSWDATRVVRRVINAPQAVVYEIALNADFLDAVRNSVAVRVLFALREAAEWLVTTLRWRRRTPPAPAASLRLSDLTERGEWVLLGKDWPNEIAFGAIGRFWAAETKWRPTTADGFARFAQPGFAKIGCNIHLRALAGGRTLVTYEARTKATDDASRRAFLRYWRIVAPFVAIVMRSLLATMDRAASYSRAARSE